MSTPNVSDRLRDLATRVERNVPHHRDPEQFHIEKSEIACELRRLASHGRKPPAKSTAST